LLQAASFLPFHFLAAATAGMSDTGALAGFRTSDAPPDFGALLAKFFAADEGLSLLRAVGPSCACRLQRCCVALLAATATPRLRAGCIFNWPALGWPASLDEISGFLYDGLSTSATVGTVDDDEAIILRNRQEIGDDRLAFIEAPRAVAPARRAAGAVITRVDIFTMASDKPGGATASTAADGLLELTGDDLFALLAQHAPQRQPELARVLGRCGRLLGRRGGGRLALLAAEALAFPPVGPLHRLLADVPLLLRAAPPGNAVLRGGRAAASVLRRLVVLGCADVEDPSISYWLGVRALASLRGLRGSREAVADARSQLWRAIEEVLRGAVVALGPGTTAQGLLTFTIRQSFRASTEVDSCWAWLWAIRSLVKGGISVNGRDRRGIAPIDAAAASVVAAARTAAQPCRCGASGSVGGVVARDSRFGSAGRRSNLGRLRNAQAPLQLAVSEQLNAGRVCALLLELKAQPTTDHYLQQQRTGEQRGSNEVVRRAAKASLRRDANTGCAMMMREPVAGRHGVPRRRSAASANTSQSGPAAGSASGARPSIVRPAIRRRIDDWLQALLAAADCQVEDVAGAASKGNVRGSLRGACSRGVGRGSSIGGAIPEFARQRIRWRRRQHRLRAENLLIFGDGQDRLEVVPWD